MKAIRKISIYILLFCVLIFALEILVQSVDVTTKKYRTSGAVYPPHSRVAIVFGAGLFGKTLSPILQDRVEASITLYKAGVVEKLLMSGDNRAKDYNEVRAMQVYAVDKGIPEKDITVDFAGLSTYESCYRAKQIFGVDKAILVTQFYHMPRALFTCRKLGIDAYGYEVQDFNKYPNLKTPYLKREELATFKMLVELYVTKPKPTFLGSYVGIQ